MNPFNIAAKGKGFGGVITRFGSIGGRYGFSPGKMDQTLTHFSNVLRKFGVGATFPITAVTLSRNKFNIEKFQENNIEFAIHGFFHRDYSQLPKDVQLTHVERAILLFEKLGIIYSGFRCPYLRWNVDTLDAVVAGNLQYESSQGIAWDINGQLEPLAYERVLRFYRAESASHYPSLPRIDNGLVRIPYGLPDDEAFVERFQFKNSDQMSEIWVSILNETYRLGELFTLGLHPERIYQCEIALSATLTKAMEFSPPIWITRLDNISKWWIQLNETRVAVECTGDNDYQFTLDGPEEAVFITRGAEPTTPQEKWDVFSTISREKQIRVRSATKPVIGISMTSAPHLASFLRQQGYIAEIVNGAHNHSIYLDYPNFSREDERRLLLDLEASRQPIVKIGRWPDGARSALCVTGDIDALTVWDYGLRILGN